MKTYLEKYKDLGLVVIRLVIGFSFIVIHGWSKITGGPETWGKLGKAMSNLGITFFPEFWGFMSSVSEFGGGILLILGLFTRPAAFFMGFTMFVAITNHLSRLDPWGRVFYPVEMLAVFLGLLFLGAGKFSLDAVIFKKK